MIDFFRRIFGSVRLLSYDTFMRGITKIPQDKQVDEESVFIDLLQSNKSVLKDEAFCRITLEKMIGANGKTYTKPYTSKHFSQTQSQREDMWSVHGCNLVAILQQPNVEMYLGTRKSWRRYFSFLGKKTKNNECTFLLKVVFWKQKEHIKRTKIVYYIGGEHAKTFAQTFFQVIKVKTKKNVISLVPYSKLYAHEK